MTVLETPHDGVPRVRGAATGRRDALRDAAREAHEGERRGVPVLAVRPFAESGAAVAIGGPFDRAAVDRLTGALRDLIRAACRDLVVDVGATDPSDARLARALGRVRMCALVAGTRIEWCRVPEALRDAIHPGVTESFTVSDG